MRKGKSTIDISGAVRWGLALLKENNIDTPHLECEVLLSYVLKCSRLKIITEGSMEITDEQYENFKGLLMKRAKGMPTAYLVGEKEFMGLDFTVRPGVLIPRCDTEIVAQTLIEECKKLKEPVKFADVCCGSGAIGISGVKYVPDAYGVLIDISEIAVEVSEENAKRNGVLDSVKVLEGDLLSPVMEQKFDIVVSNPPYIKTGVIDTLQRDVKDFEPHIALDGGDDGLEFYRLISGQAVGCLKEGGRIIFEIGYDQAESVKYILKANGFRDIRVFKDLAGNDRCIAAARIAAAV